MIPQRHPVTFVLLVVWFASATGSVASAQFMFAPQPAFSSDARAAMALSDLDGDGDFDLVTVDGVLNIVGVHLSNGDGTFEPPTTMPIAAGVRALAVGDVTGDMLADIVITFLGTLGGGNGSLSVLTNQGAGVFAAPVDHLVLVPGIAGQQVTPVSLTIADLDGVGNLDVGVGTVLLNETNQPGFFSVVINTGVDAAMQPIFADSVNLDTLDSNTRAIVSGDFDNDTDIDLALASAAGRRINSVSVVLNNGDGTFAPTDRTRLSGTATTVGRIIAADVDGDGFLDLVTINQSHTYSIVLNNGIALPGRFNDTGQFNLGSQATTPTDIPADGELSDIDGDGDLDLVVGLVGSSGGTGSLVVLANDGTGAFGPEMLFAPGRDHSFVQVADLDGDTDQDVVSEDATSGTAIVLLNQRLPVTVLSMLTSSAPPTEASLWRKLNNTMRLTFSKDITVPPAGSILVQQMLPTGLFGAELSAGFQFTVENDIGGNPRILKIVDVGPSDLVHRQWYSIRNVGAWLGVSDFIVQYIVQVGDADGDKRILNGDVSLINTAIPLFSAADDDRRDIDGDGRVLNGDVSTTNVNIPSFTVAKPTGH